jgi:hypothetical protein
VLVDFIGRVGREDGEAGHSGLRATDARQARTDKAASPRCRGPVDAPVR